MDAEQRIVLDNGSHKVEADIAVLKIHASQAGALTVYTRLEEAQKYIRDAIMELMPDAPEPR